MATKQSRLARFGNMNRIANNPRFITQALVNKLMEEVSEPRSDEALQRMNGGAKVVVTTAQRKAHRRKLDFLVDTMVTLAMNGDQTMIKYVIDRIEGTPIQSMMFKPMSPEEQDAYGKDEQKSLEVSFKRLKEMKPADVTALYREAILKTQGANAA